MGGLALDNRDKGLVARVVATVLAEIRVGAISPSGQLSSERECADRLKVSRNTVTAAYAELERNGIIRRLHGKGSFLCALPTSSENFSWGGKISSSANRMDEPVLELLARRCADTIEFPLSAGTPALAAFPADCYAAAVQQVVSQDVPAAFAVAATEGQWRLREALATWLNVAPQHVMVTAGAQEGIDLLARCLIEPGDFVVTESPVYAGAIQSFRSAGARLLPWTTEWDLGRLEDLLLRYHPKFLFTTPSFQNPTGRTMDQRTREGLLELAYRYRLPVIEDDVYAQLYFDMKSPPASLYSQDTRSQVIAVSTFSKMLAPGLRIGWLLAPLYMIKQLSLIKMRSNLFTGGLNQLVLARMLNEGDILRHLSRIRCHHAGLASVAMRALEPAIEAGWIHCSVPEGSLYLWCRLGADIDPEALFLSLESRDVSVAPGSAFQPDVDGSPWPCFRICFTACESEPLKCALAILVQTLGELHRVSHAKMGQRKRLL